jgi:hypothetical protein
MATVNPKEIFKPIFFGPSNKKTGRFTVLDRINGDKR